MLFIKHWYWISTLHQPILKAQVSVSLVGMDKTDHLAGMVSVIDTKNINNMCFWYLRGNKSWLKQRHKLSKQINILYICLEDEKQHTIYEYHRVEIDITKIISGSAFEFTHLPSRYPHKLSFKVFAHQPGLSHLPETPSIHEIINVYQKIALNTLENTQER